MNNAAALKQLFATPLVLFLVMILASIVNMLKQVIVARQQGGTITCAQYLEQWPELVAAFAANVITFILMVNTDTLNLMSALSAGYGCNSLADLIRPGGRSQALAQNAIGSDAAKALGAAAPSAPFLQPTSTEKRP